MIKLNQFALEQGVSNRQIQRLVAKYSDEIEGMYERRGQNGTWLSEEACEILKTKMRLKPDEVYDDSKDKEIERLNNLIAEKDEAIKIKEQLLATLELKEIEVRNKLELAEKEKFLIEEKSKEMMDDFRSQIRELQTSFKTTIDEKNEELDAKKEALDQANIKRVEVEQERDSWKEEAESFERTWFGFYRKKKV